jgi:hypothetical protein
MKESPFDLVLAPTKTFTKTFTHFNGPQWTCSCGQSFDGGDGLCPFTADQTGHVVTENEPAKKFQIKFKVLSSIEGIGIYSFASKIQEKHVTGIGKPNTKDFTSPMLIAGANGRPVILNEETCRVIAILHRAQCPDRPEDAYSVEELAAFMLSDSICQQMFAASIAAQVGGEDDGPLDK